MHQFRENTIAATASIKQALAQLNKVAPHLILFVVNSEKQLIGTLTDGDVRRALLAGKNLEEQVVQAMCTSFRYVKARKYDLKYIQNIKRLGIQFLPLLDENGCLVEVFDLHKTRALLPLDAVIMAGGRGSRLRPLTDTVPKPLLKIGDKPIIAHNVERLKNYGVRNLHISIKYLGQQLVDYFGDGKERNMHISYVEENEPLGTIGAVGLIDNFENDVVLVMNSDLLTTIDFERLYTTFINNKADMIVASVPYEVKIPYAVLETAADRIVSFKEKPTYTYYSNAGIYLIKKSVLSLIPKNSFYNATDLMEELIAGGYKVSYYPILGYWLDIGKPVDFKKAKEDIQHLSL